MEQKKVKKNEEKAVNGEGNIEKKKSNVFYAAVTDLILKNILPNNAMISRKNRINKMVNCCINIMSLLLR